MNAPHAAGWRFRLGIAIIDLMLGSWLMADGSWLMADGAHRGGSGSRQKLCAEFPEHSALIEQLTIE